MHQMWPVPEWMKCMGSENGGGRVRNIRIHHCPGKVPVCNLIIKGILSAKNHSKHPAGVAVLAATGEHSGNPVLLPCWQELVHLHVCGVADVMALNLCCSAATCHPPTLERTRTWGEPTQWFCDQTKGISSTHHHFLHFPTHRECFGRHSEAVVII